MNCKNFKLKRIFNFKSDFVLNLRNSVFDFYKIVGDLKNNLDSYLELDDRVLFLNTNLVLNLMSPNDELKLKSFIHFRKCSDLTKRLQTRKLYKIVSKKIVTKNLLKSNSKDVIKTLIESKPVLADSLCTEDIGLVVGRIKLLFVKRIALI
jgi:hypothetical protein